MFRPPQRWGTLAAFGATSILTGVAIVAAADTEHDWGWVLIVAGTVATVVGRRLYLILRPEPEPVFYAPS